MRGDWPNMAADLRREEAEGWIALPMYLLDLHTLFVALVALTLITTLLLTGAAMSSAGESEVRLWAIGNLAVCAGFALGQLTHAPVWVHGVASYGVIGAGIGIVYCGIEVFQEGRTRWWVTPAVALLGMVGPYWFAVVDADVSLRLRSASAAHGIACIGCAARLLRGGVLDASAGARTAATSLGVLGLLLLVRASLPLWRATDVTTQTEALTLLAVICCQVAGVFGLLLMLANRAAGEIRRLSLIDPLTGLLNRAGLAQAAQRRLERARLSGRPVALLEFDVDHFKLINDTYGHPTGDAVLSRIATLAGSALRAPDLLSRHGGEEFVAVLTDTSLPLAAQVAERLRAAIASGELSTDGRRLAATVSVGVAGSAAHGYDLEALLAAADAALYEAKRAGRNAVRMARGPTVLATASSR